MAKRTRASARRASMRAPSPRRLKCTDALLAHVRHRFEASDEPLATMAADLGCSHETVRNIAKREGWVRHVPSPRDLSPAARLAARAERLAEQGAAALSLPPRSGGEGRPPELAQPAKADGVGGLDGSQQPPAPNPSPPFAARMGGGEENAAPPAQHDTAPSPPPQLADTAEQLHRELQMLLADVRAERERMKREGHGKHDLREMSGTIASLGAVLRSLQPMLCAVPQAGADPAYDDMPADIDEFRNEFARRIRAFFAARRGGGDADGNAAPSVAAGG